MDSRPNLAVRLIRQEMFGADRYALDPAQPTQEQRPCDPCRDRVWVHVVHDVEESAEPRELDEAVMTDEAPRPMGFVAVEADEPDNAGGCPVQGGRSVGMPDTPVGGMLDVFA